jgi:hypothetical protein
VVCRFVLRRDRGLAECLRKAADAVELAADIELLAILETFAPVERRISKRGTQ